MSKRNDHYVPWMGMERIQKIAKAWRESAKLGRLNWSFDITEFVTQVLAKKFLKKGPLSIKFLENDAEGPPAYVTYKPLTLHIKKRVWELARAGHGRSRFIVAHEIGHILLHDHTAQAFSGNPDLQNKFAQREHSAEWQADTFAAHFLLPDEVAEQFDSVDAYTELCKVNQELACETLERITESKRRSSADGNACSECGNFSLVWSGSGFKCTTCGSTEKCAK